MRIKKISFEKNYLFGIAAAVIPIFSGIFSAPLISRGLGPTGRGEVVIWVTIGAIWGVVSGLGIPWGSRLDLMASDSRIKRWDHISTIVSGIMILIALVTGLILAIMSFRNLLPIFLLLVLNSLSAKRTFYASIIMREWGNYLVSLIQIISIFSQLSMLFIVFVTDTVTVGWVITSQCLGLFLQISGNYLYYLLTSRRIRTISTDSEIISWKDLVQPFLAQLKDGFLSKSDILILILENTNRRNIGLYSLPGLMVQFSYQVSSQISSVAMVRAKSKVSRLNYAIKNGLYLIVPTSLAATITSRYWVTPIFGSNFSDSVVLFGPSLVISIGICIWIPSNSLVFFKLNRNLLLSEIFIFVAEAIICRLTKTIFIHKIWLMAFTIMVLSLTNLFYVRINISSE